MPCGSLFGKSLWGAVLLILPLRVLAVDPMSPGWARSFGGEFVVHAPPAAAPTPPLPKGAKPSAWVSFDVQTAAVSCERVKTQVVSLLDLPDSQIVTRNRVHVRLLPAVDRGRPVLCVARRFADGWQYYLSLPERMKGAHFVEALVQVVLLQYANRQGGRRSAEIPLWLTEGITGFLAPKEPLLALRQRTSVDQWFVRRDPLAWARDYLAIHPPLTFTELSLAEPGDQTDDARRAFRANAQLFLASLLQLPDGRACLRRMLEVLPRYWNWQTAFFLAFHAHFQRPLDAEKWWAVYLASMNTRHPTPTPLGRADGIRRLKAVLQVPVEVRWDANELPLHDRVPLSKAIAEWDYARQKPVLDRVLAQLSVLQFTVSPEVRQLVVGYTQALASYRERRERADYASPGKGHLRLRPELILRETLQRLQSLHAALERLQRGISGGSVSLPPATARQTASVGSR